MIIIRYDGLSEDVREGSREIEKVGGRHSGRYYESILWRWEVDGSGGVLVLAVLSSAATEHS
jgi:hypothetical protein